MLRGEEAHRPLGVSEQVLNQQISEWKWFSGGEKVAKPQTHA